MPTLITLEDGSVRWDYDLPTEPKPGSKAALVALAESLGLSTEGTKKELEQRIAAAGSDNA